MFPVELCCPPCLFSPSLRKESKNVTSLRPYHYMDLDDRRDDEAAEEANMRTRAHQKDNLQTDESKT